MHSFPMVNPGNGPAARIVSRYADDVRLRHVNYNKTKFETLGRYSVQISPSIMSPIIPFLGKLIAM